MKKLLFFKKRRLSKSYIFKFQRLVFLLLLFFLTFTVSSQVTISPWRMHHGGGVINVSNIGFHGNPSAYQHSNIPSNGDSSWQAAPVNASGQINYSVGSILTQCLTQLNFTYFETNINIPTNFNVNDLNVTFSAADDGARAYIFNSDYPNGAFIGEIRLGQTPVTANYASLSKAGEINRLVIVQFDDCPSGNNLRGAQVKVNGQAIQPSDLSISGSVTNTTCNDSNGSINLTTSSTGNSPIIQGQELFDTNFMGNFNSSGFSSNNMNTVNGTPFSLELKPNNSSNSWSSSFYSNQTFTKKTGLTFMGSVFIPANGYKAVMIGFHDGNSNNQTASIQHGIFFFANDDFVQNVNVNVSGRQSNNNAVALGSAYPNSTTTAPDTFNGIKGTWFDMKVTLTNNGAIYAVKKSSETTFTNSASLNNISNLNNFRIGVQMNSALSTPQGEVEDEVITYHKNWRVIDGPNSTTNLAPGTYTYYVNDETNSAQQSVSLTVNSNDTTAPVLNGIPANVTVQCDAVPTIANVSATDNCDTNVSVNFNEERTDGVNINNYTLTRTWSTTDSSGNSSSATQIITVVDTTAPIFNGVPADVTVQCDDVPDTAAVTATDNCDTNVSVNFNEERTDGININNYILTRTWSTTDLSGNSSSATQIVTVVDTTPPAIVGQDISVTLTSNGTVSIVANDVLASGSDNCGTVTYTINQDTFGATDAINSPVTIQLIGTDTSGNTTTIPVLVTVIDPVPVPSCQNIIVQLDGNGQVSITPQMIDNGSSSVVGIGSLALDKMNFTCANVGDNTVTLIVTSTLGSSASCTATVTVQDNIAPSVSTQPITLELDANGNVVMPNNTVSSPVFSEDFTNDSSQLYTSSITNWNIISGDIDLGNYISGIPGNEIDLEGNNNSVVESKNLISLSPGNYELTFNYINNNAGSGNSFNVSFGSLINETINSLGSIQSKTISFSIAQNASEKIRWEQFGPADRSGTFIGNIKLSKIITSYAIDAGNSDNCGVATTSVNKTNFTCSDLGENTVELTVTDVNGNSSSANATVTIVDNIAPQFLTVESHIIYLNENGVATFDPASFNANTVTDNCNVDTITFDKTTFNCNEVGFHTINATATDSSGNTTVGPVNIEVRDEIAPTVITQNIIVDLDVNGNASITPQMVDNGTFDNCAFTLSLNISDFTCAQVGNNIVELTAQDQNGVITSANATVTVRDVTLPTAIIQNISIDLDANGNASITPQMIDNGSSDTCGIASLDVSKDSFNCSNVGDNTVTLTVTDVNGNVATQTAIVAVNDVTPPTTITKDITVELDANGAATITPSMVDYGSSDACEFSLSLDTTSFDCSNVGNNTVTLIATDVNGNTSSATANVNVVDSVLPTVITQSISVDLDDQGNASITKEQIDNGSNDACGVASTSIDITSFDCSNLGDNTVTLTVTDVNGNTATETAIVTVNDVTPPTLGTQNISVTLDANGNATISPQDVIINSEDDIERGTECDVSDTKYHAMYLSNYSTGYYHYYWKNGKKQEASKGIMLNEKEAISTLDNLLNEKQPSQENSSRHSWWRKNARFKFDANGGKIIKNLDGTATVTGTLVNKRNANDKWIVTLNLKNASTWDQWKAQGRWWKGNRRKVGQTYKDWTYYEMAAGSKLTGAGNNAGKETNLYHAPYNRKYGFQLGDNANLKNANFGLSGWFYYKNKKGRWAQGDFNLNVTDCSQLPVPEGTVFTSDNCSITNYSLDINSFGCDNLGENIVNVTVTDQSGNSTTKPVTVTVLGEKPTITIPDFRTVWGQKKNTVFLGYKESTHLCPVVSGGTGFTYQWTDSSGNVFSTEKFPEVSPTITSTYTVTVTNSNGCTDTASIEVCVIDARAKDRRGRYNGKVKVCHHTGHRHDRHCPGGSAHHSSSHGNRDRPISVSWYAVPAHLWYHGDTLGACDAECEVDEIFYKNNETKVAEIKSIQKDVLVYPNPSNGVFEIKLNDNTKTATKILLFDISGKLVDSKDVSKNNLSENIAIGRNNLSEGIYLLRIISNNETVTKKLIVKKN